MRLLRKALRATLERSLLGVRLLLLLLGGKGGLLGLRAGGLRSRLGDAGGARAWRHHAGGAGAGGERGGRGGGGGGGGGGRHRAALFKESEKGRHDDGRDRTG